MEEFKWDPDYSVDHEVIDNHHKKLISLFNELGALIDNDQELPLFSTIKVISELNIYAIFHFKEEEQLMKDSDYPDLAKHIILHKEFINKVDKFKDEYLNNDSLLNYEMFNYLSDWILTHIVNEDSKYVDYL